MRRLSHTEPYRVEVAPEAWSQVGVVSGSAFKRIQAELANVAALLGADREALAGRPRESFAVSVDEYVGRYEVDHERRAVILAGLTRTAPG